MVECRKKNDRVEEETSFGFFKSNPTFSSPIQLKNNSFKLEENYLCNFK